MQKRKFDDVTLQYSTSLSQPEWPIALVNHDMFYISSKAIQQNRKSAADFLRYNYVL